MGGGESGDIVVMGKLELWGFGWSCGLGCEVFVISGVCGVG